MKTLFINAQLVCPTEILEGNLLIENERIIDIDVPSDTPADHRVDLTGKYLMPGVIDDQVHFREPGLTHKEDLQHATRACARGGVTSFLEMPNTNPATITVQALHDKLKLASDRCLVNYGFQINNF